MSKESMSLRRLGFNAVFLAVLFQTQATALASAPVTPAAPAHRTGEACGWLFWGVKALPLDAISQETDKVWLLAWFQPAPIVVKLPPIIIDDKGHLISAPSLPATQNYEGIVAVVSALTRQPSQKVYDYRFAHWFGSFQSAMSDWLPFVSGGLYVCCVNEAQEWPRQLSPTYEIPDEWCDFVASGVAFIKAHAALFHQVELPGNKDLLRHLVDDSNPLIAITAYRTLAKAGAVDAPMIDHAFKESDPIEQAVTLFLLFSGSGEIPWPAVIEHVNRMVNTAESAEELVPLLLATANTWPLNPFGPPIQAHCQEILKCLQSRAGDLGPQSPGAEYLRRFLHSRGMDPVYARGPGAVAH